ncbi:hypothetical protein [Haloarcula litorea]|nr:hypothetical protein [Halomicroarcula sp. GDY20]
MPAHSPPTTDDGPGTGSAALSDHERASAADRAARQVAAALDADHPRPE